MGTLRNPSFAALALLALSVHSPAQIQSLTLPEMIQTADGAVYGQIIGARTFRLDSPEEGRELYFTTLTLQGRGLSDARPITLDITYSGGFVSATEGVFNSEAPAADDVRLGRHVVAFYSWSNDLGGGVPANTLVALHGGIYRTVDGPRGAAVLGRGEGYAIRANVRVAELESACKTLFAAKQPR